MGILKSFKELIKDLKENRISTATVIEGRGMSYKKKIPSFRYEMKVQKQWYIECGGNRKSPCVRHTGWEHDYPGKRTWGDKVGSQGKALNTRLESKFCSLGNTIIGVF